MAEMKPYVIRQGDHLIKLAHKLGFAPEEVWDDPKNAELKEERGDGSILRPGDILHVPDRPRKKLPFEKATTNSYVAKLPMLPVSLRLGSEGELLAEEPYVIEGLGPEPIEGKSDGDGMIELEVPADLRELTVVLPERNERFQLKVGDLDPVDQPSGLRMRLTHLGYYNATLQGQDGYVGTEEDRLAAGLRAFQVAAELEPTGELDDETRAKLLEAHGS